MAPVRSATGSRRPASRPAGRRRSEHRRDKGPLDVTRLPGTWAHRPGTEWTTTRAPLFPLPPITARMKYRQEARRGRAWSRGAFVRGFRSVLNKPRRREPGAGDQALTSAVQETSSDLRGGARSTGSSERARAPQDLTDFSGILNGRDQAQAPAASRRAITLISNARLIRLAHAQ